MASKSRAITWRPAHAVRPPALLPVEANRLITLICIIYELLASERGHRLTECRNLTFRHTPQSRFQDESKCEVFFYEDQLPFTLKLQLITITKISHLDSVSKRDWGNSKMACCTYSWEPFLKETTRIDHFHKWRRILLFLCIYVN